MEKMNGSADNGPLKERASIQVQVIKHLWCPTGDQADDFAAFDFIARCFAEYWNLPGKKTVSGAISYVNARHIGEVLETISKAKVR